MFKEMKNMLIKVYIIFCSMKAVEIVTKGLCTCVYSIPSIFDHGG